MATFKKKKISFKSIISLVLVIGAVIALGAGITALAKDETRTVSSVGTFVRGGLDEETGKFIKTENSIVTEELIECAGLTVTPDFDSTVKYQIFWYNVDKIFFKHTELSDGVFSGNVPECANYCRIVIVPETDKDSSEDGTIKFWEIPGIAKQLKVEVLKDQSVLPVDLYQVAVAKKASKGYVVKSIDEPYSFYENKYFYYNDNDADGSTHFVEGMTDYLTSEHCVVKLNCKDVAKYKCEFAGSYEGENELWIDYFDSNGKAIDRVLKSGYKGETFMIDVNENAEYVIFNIFSGSRPIVINAYLPR